MYGEFQKHIEREIAGIREAGFYKEERVIATPQGAEIGVTGGKSVINMCANNYLADFRYLDGADFQPSDAEVKKLRPAN